MGYGGPDPPMSTDKKGIDAALCGDVKHTKKSSKHPSVVVSACKFITFLICVVLAIMVSAGIYSFTIERKHIYATFKQSQDEDRVFVNSEVCTNLELRTKSGKHSSCIKSEIRVDEDITSQATLEAFRVVFGCSQWCERLYDDMYSLTRIAVVVLMLSLAYMFWYYLDLKRSEDKFYNRFVQLPSHVTADNKFE